MQIQLENILQQEDPCQMFLDSIKNDETRQRYNRRLLQFLKLIPEQIYQDNIGKKPMCQDVGTLAKFFVRLAKKKPDTARNIIIAYVKENKKRVEKKEISPNTLPNAIKPIKRLLDANNIEFHWKSIYLLYPRKDDFAKDRAYTREELQKMIEVSNDITDKIIVEMFSSGGFRLGAWDYLTWKDVTFFKNSDGSYSGAALKIYEGDPEKYTTYITPEACQTLELYREQWKSLVGKYPQPDDPILKVTKIKKVERLDSQGIKKRVFRMAEKIGLRPPLAAGQKRHEVQLDHGFRKYFNTMLRRAKLDFADKETMMGHKIGLERNYERYREDGFETFSEYQKAIPFLTISETERVKLENQKLKEEKTELVKMQENLNESLRKVEELWADKQRMENIHSNQN